ncbi:MAG: glycosyltransferase family 9 protein [Bdellovibrionales bacterium]
MAPGSVWATKKWTAEGYAELAKKLQENGYQIAFIGAENEKEECEKIIRQVGRAINLCGSTNLIESMLLMRRSALLVTNDTGAAHLASLVGLKTISIFGPTVLEFGYRPWNSASIINQVPLKCRPCGKHGSDKCPIGTHDCMKLVNATNVLINAEKLLNKL